ncbi:hypothetical protein [Pyxidicoccus caerfyrddinensis]|uniref:hypothetical protein n=1 Tax=Pyxidicoccus caerfyrddinensis TaxID=2709663 RepID=UPI0019683E1A|nr:hypothetical protein [Pyxidicoccus caerfyrddinensis]
MSARARLARAQEELVRALGTGAPVPPGFDAERVRASALALLDKRRRLVQRAWPGLASALNTDFAPRFEAWAREHPMSVEPSPLADGRRFARALEAVGCLPASLTPLLQDFDARWRLTGEGELVPRRGLVLSLARVGEARRWRLVLRLPGGQGFTWWVSRGGGDSQGTGHRG